MGTALFAAPGGCHKAALVSPVGGPHSTREIEGAAVALQRKRRAKKMRKFRLWWGIGVLRRGLGVQ